MTAIRSTASTQTSCGGGQRTQQRQQLRRPLCACEQQLAVPQARAAAATALGHTSVEVPGWYSSNQPENFDSLCSWPNSGHTVHLRR